MTYCLILPLQLGMKRGIRLYIRKARLPFLAATGSSIRLGDIFRL